MDFPIELKEKLHRLFGHQFEEFYSLKDKEPFKGLRINRLKCDESVLSQFEGLEKTPFCPDGFYIKGDERLGNHPLHHAGAFYIQEPSATSAVEVLSPERGDYVLDLCAAPGGKSTQIAAKLQNEGLIWANEISSKRAAILLSNFERMGVANGVISNASPEVLCPALENAFDKVLVDAPCSGEGMMRNDSEILRDWNKENIDACAIRQLKILDSASLALKEGGILVYSTCTFSKEENEDVTERFLQAHPEFSPLPLEVSFGMEGFSGKHTRRILWQHGGEGHFIAKFQKRGSSPRQDLAGERDIKLPILDDFLSENGITLPKGKIIRSREKLFLSPDILVPSGINILRRGLPIGELAKNRIIPHHGLFACPAVLCENEINLQASSRETSLFLHGDEIETDAKKGFCRVNIAGVPCSFGKAGGGRLKNHYPKGLRRLK